MADDAADPTTPKTGDEKAVDAPDAPAVGDSVASDASDEPDTATEPAPDAAETPARAPMSHVRLALILGLVLVVALGGLAGWLGFRAYEAHRAETQRQLFLEAGRQGALDLTTIDFTQADQDVQRILDNATGQFYDDFQRRSQPFAQVVQQVKSKSVGTVTEAGVVDESDSAAKVLVAVTVTTAVEGQPDQAPRAWRMKISVEKVGDDAKVSNVEFVQ